MMALPPNFDAMAKRAGATLTAAERAYHQPAASLSEHLDCARACVTPKLERVR